MRRVEKPQHPAGLANELVLEPLRIGKALAGRHRPPVNGALNPFSRCPCEGLDAPNHVANPGAGYSNVG